MAESDELKRIINESSELSRRGEDRKALELLDNSITEAISKSDNTKVRVLSRHAAVVSDHIGDLDLVRYYSERLLACSPNDPLALYSVSDALARKGLIEEAKSYATRAYKLSLQGASEQDAGLAEAIKKRWPEVVDVSEG